MNKYIKVFLELPDAIISSLCLRETVGTLIKPGKDI